ncbi:MAG: T9SS type A sorting domain-containing protein, partial [Candidatus Electryoneaceae bacterium]|nr:T9SS type A sorting domain-containing protein [Candidatus Electryoneaceae bacterium]
GYVLTETDGNEDNDVNPGETLELELTAINPGDEEDVPDVTAVISSLSPWVEVDEDANEIVLGDIDAGVEVEGEQSVTIIIDPTCPDVASRPHTQPSLLIEFVSGENRWSSAIQLEPVSPNFDMFEVIGGIIIPADEEEYDLDIDIINVGAMDAPQMTARLESLEFGIAVIVDESQYVAMDAGDHNSLDGQDFVITVNRLTVPGTMVDMLLILTSDDDFVDTVYFALQADEPAENDPLGPDDYGYIAFDDTDEDWDMAPEYDWIEISLLENDRDFRGELIEFEGDAPLDIGEAVVIEMPFDLVFYGYEYDVITVATNGFIAVGDQEDMVNFQNWPLDRGIGGLGMIAPFWDWLEFDDASRVYTYYDEDGAQFIIEWYCLRHYDGGEDDLTFQVILYDPDVWVNESGDADITFQYHSIRNVEGPEHGRAERERNNYYASVGISSPDGTTGISYTWDNEYPVNAAELDEGRAIRFSTTPQFQNLVLGCVYGQVTDADDNAPIEDARILLMSEFGFWANTVTDELGNYFLEFPLFAALSFTITTDKQGYNEAIAWGDISQDEDSTLINFELLHPEFALSVEQVSEMVCPDETIDIDFAIYNDGNGPLEWTMEKRLPDNAHFDPWRLRQSFFVAEAVDDGRIMGAVFADDHFYCTGGGNDTNYVYVLDRDGEQIDRLEQFNYESRYGMRDLAWDGSLLWGIDGQTVYGFTTEGEVQTEFEAPYNPTTAIAWDPDRQVLWMSGIVTRNIVGYNRDGEEIMSALRQGFRISGLAYWTDDPDGYPLYIFHKVGSDQQTVHKMDPETGDTMFVNIPMPELGGRPEGAFITNQYDVYSWVFMGISNNATNDGGDRIDVWQLEGRTDWFNLNIIEGGVEAGGEQELTLRFDPIDLPLVRFEGSLVFRHNAAGGETSLPVIMDVVVDVPQEDQTVQPMEFDLTAIYPNPFNAQATISYTVPDPSFVSVNVYDLAGRLVTTLADRDHTAGRHTVIWDGNGIASGIYWVCLESSETSMIRKVVLMK